MKFKLTILLVLILFINSLHSQTSSVLNYHDTIIVGVQKYEEGKYDDAIKYFLKVPESDSNYVDAVTELMYTYYGKEDFQSAVNIGEKVFYGGYNIDPSFVLNLGSSLDQLERYTDAINLYKTALKKFPLNYLLYYNIGYTYGKMKKYNESIEAYKTSIEINPVYAKAHYQLGLYAINEGKTTLGIIALNAYLMVRPNQSGSNSVLSLLNEICSSKYKENAEPKNIDIEFGSDFSELDLLVENYLALDKKFKVKSKIQLPFVKQTYLVFKKLSEMEDDNSFWYRTYIPIYKEIIKNKNFEYYSYYITQSSESKKHQKIIAKNASKIKSFSKWLFENIDELHRTYYLPFPKSKYKDHIVYRGNSHFAVSFIGHRTNNIITGYSESYYPNGAVASTVFYNDKGHYEGAEIKYYSNGRIKSRGYYKDGVLQDSLISYSKFGRRSIFYTVKDGKLRGKLIYYNKSGALSTEVNVIENLQQGDKLRYYDIGTLFSKVNMKDNKAEGRYISYYNTGEKKEVANYTEGKLNGKDTSYYKNGEIEAIIDFKDDLYNGKYISYYKNGKTHVEGDYKEGKTIGKHIEYDEDGTIISESNYDENGKKNGVYKEFYDDGKSFYELDYRRGDVVAYKYFNRDGSILKEGKRKLGSFDFVGYHRNGQKSSEGKYGTKYHQGEWKYYDQYGNLYAIKNYKNGDLDGKTVNFFPTGDIQSVEYFKEGKDYGYFFRNDAFGTKIKEGYLENGESIGLWKTYFYNGKLKAERFFLHNEIDGFKNEYSPSGQLYRRTKFEEDVIVMQIDYDENGNPIDSNLFVNGSGKLETHFKNSKQIKQQYYLKNNNIHGKYFSYYPNGNIAIEGQYFAGKSTGEWKYYYPNKQLSKIGTYIDGDREGVWKTYYENGTLQSQKEYKNDQLNGNWKIYFDNGKLEAERTYKDNEINGKSINYTNTGVYVFTRYYTEGALYAYEYKTANGTKHIDVKNGTANIVAYFKNGKKAREYTYDKGWFQGEYKEYYPSGKIYESINFKNNDYVNDKVTYFPNGKIKRKISYNNGVAEGTAKEYNSTGKLIKTTEYLQGYKHGPEKIFDKYGKLKYQYIYYYDDLIEIIK